MKKKITSEIELNRIVVDEELYPRNQYNWQTAYDYSESMKTGADFPKMVVAKHNNVFILVDGRHRLEATKIVLGKKKFNEAKKKVEVLIGLSKREIYTEGIRRNIVHGLRFSVQEKLKIAVKLKDLKYSMAEISKLVHITVHKLKDLTQRRVVMSDDGKIVLKSTFERTGGNHENIESIQQPFKGQFQLNLVKELVTLLETKTIDLEDKKVYQELLQLKKLLRNIK